MSDNRLRGLGWALLLWVLVAPAALAAPEAGAPDPLDELSERVRELEREVSGLRNEVGRLPSGGGSAAGGGAAAFLFGGFCALWAQNTGRNAWLWFFLGLLLSVIAVLVLLYKNAKDAGRTRP